MRRQITLKPPHLDGDDPKDIQRALGMTEGVDGGFTAAAVEEWKWRTGYPANRLNAILGLWGQALLFGELEPPADYTQRAEERKGQEFVPLRNGVARPIAVPTGRRSEFMLPDGPEGADAPGGKNFHGGEDWFAPAGTAVRAPVDGTIVESRERKKSSGQVFGGVVEARGADGKIWVLRHVDPKGVAAGSTVARGQIIAVVSAWTGGATHAHIEVWKTAEGGYKIGNMIDPMKSLSLRRDQISTSGAASASASPVFGVPARSISRT